MVMLGSGTAFSRTKKKYFFCGKVSSFTVVSQRRKSSSGRKKAPIFPKLFLRREASPHLFNRLRWVYPPYAIKVESGSVLKTVFVWGRRCTTASKRASFVSPLKVQSPPCPRKTLKRVIKTLSITPYTHYIVYWLLLRRDRAGTITQRFRAVFL